MDKTQSQEDKKPGIFRRIFRLINKLVSGLRTLINLAVLVFILVIIASLFQQDMQPLPEKAALRLNPEGILVDQKTYSDPFTQALTEGSDKPDAETLQRDVIDAINGATDDPRITSLVLDLNYLQGGGLSKLEEIGQALTDFKKSGKPIVATGDNYSQPQYYLASFANEIHLNPMGAVMLTGLGHYPSYMKQALDKLKIKVNIFRVGEYKDAIEPFSRENMSEASRAQTRLWLNDLWQIFTGKVELQRNLQTGAINEYTNNLDEKLAAANGNPARLALTEGLVDRLSTRPEILQHLRNLAGPDDNQGYAQIPLKTYVSHIRRNALLKSAGDEAAKNNQIAVVVASGTILDGKQPAGAIGGDSLVSLLKKVEEGDYRAMLLRIDSPGGSAFASEVIRQQINQIKKRGIPIVVSMSSVAASGGYWVSSGADEIWANPGTITGSIGVFGIIPTFDESLGALGIKSDGVGTTDIADIMHLERPMSDIAKSVIQQNVEDTYREFISLVAESRKSSPEAIHSIAQGRVWSGQQAKELGLVDKLGTFQDAIQGTADLAGLETFSLDYLKPPMTFYEQLLQQLAQGEARLLSIVNNGNSQQESPGALLLRRELNRYLGLFSNLNDPGHLYLQCFECSP